MSQKKEYENKIEYYKKLISLNCVTTMSIIECSEMVQLIYHAAGCGSKKRGQIVAQKRLICLCNVLKKMTDTIISRAI